MTDTEPTFLDAEEMSHFKEKVNFRELVLTHLAKISQISTLEFREGYWERKPYSVSQGIYQTEIYHPDTRECYINSVEFLHDLLLPYFDDEMNKAEEEIENEKDKWYQHYKKKQSSANKWVTKKLTITRTLLQQLSLLLKRQGYLEAKQLKQ
jgi:hypothetical protein